MKDTKDTIIKNEYDLIVIGAGPGGYVAAIKAAKSGLSVAVIENRRVGGTCLNRGCIPAKAMIHASSLYREACEGARFGVHASDVSYDYEEILAYKQETIDTLVGGVEQLLTANGVTVIRGTGCLEMPVDGKNIVRVTPLIPEMDSPDAACDQPNKDTSSDSGTEQITLRASRVILASGSKPARIPVPGIDLPHVLNSDGLFALEHAPNSLVIIGGGVIGVEFATVFASLGCEVTIVEALPRLLDNFDKEISQNLKMILKKRGVEAYLNAFVKEIVPAGDDNYSGSDAPAGDDAPAENARLVCRFEEKGKPREISAEYVLVAAGRIPVTDGLFGEDVDIHMNGKYVAVDDYFRTSLQGVYAIGDLTGGIQLAHAASAHGVRVVEEILQEMNASFAQDISVIPAGVYTDPEIAQVGITEAQAKEQGIEVNVGKFIMTANGKSLITKDERGFIKIVASSSDHKVLGAQMMCARATDMIGEFADAIANQLTVEDMLRGIRPHPTYNEGIAEALEDVFGESLHTVPRRRR